MLIGAVAVNDLCFRQQLGKLIATLFVFFDKFDGKAELEQLFGKIIRNASASDDKNGVEFLVDPSRAPEEIRKGCARGGEMDSVAGVQNAFAVRDIDFVAVLNGSDKQTGVESFRNVADRHPVKLGTGGDDHFDQIDAPFGKGVDADGAGKTDQT